MQSVPDTDMFSMENTPFPIVLDPQSKSYYLNGGPIWYQAPEALGTGTRPVLESWRCGLGMELNAASAGRIENSAAPTGRARGGIARCWSRSPTSSSR